MDEGIPNEFQQGLQNILSLIYSLKTLPHLYIKAKILLYFCIMPMLKQNANNYPFLHIFILINSHRS